MFRRIAVICYLLASHCVLGANYFETFLKDYGPQIPLTNICQTDAGCKDIIISKIDLACATYITHTAHLLMTYELTHEVRGAANAIDRLLEQNANLLEPYQDISDYYNGVAAHIRSLDSSKHWHRALDSYVNTPLANAYEVRKWMLDESLSIIMKYPEETELQRTIKALQLINEERNPTRLAELINGGWKTDDRIVRILNGEQ